MRVDRTPGHRFCAWPDIFFARAKLSSLVMNGARFCAGKNSLFPHGRLHGPFANLTKQERTDVATKMIEIIKRRAVLGLAVTVNSDEMAEVIFEQKAEIGSVYDGAYSFCSHTILAGVSYFIERNPRIGAMAYFLKRATPVRLGPTNL